MPQLDVFLEAAKLIQQGRSAAIATIIGTTGSTPGKECAKMLVRDDGTTVGTVGGGCTENDIRQIALRVIQEDAPRRASFRITAATAAQTGLLCGGEFEVFVEPIGNPEVFIFGAGHVARCLTPILASLDYRTVVVDDRETYACREHIPQASDWLVRNLDASLDDLPIGSNSYVVVVTRGHHHDESVLREALRTDARYIGLIGSRGKIGAIFKNLREEGCDPARLEAVKGPIGLDIGSRTPEEIAVSIAAELIAVRRGVEST